MDGLFSLNREGLAEGKAQKASWPRQHVETNTCGTGTTALTIGVTIGAACHPACRVLAPVSSNTRNGAARGGGDGSKRGPDACAGWIPGTALAEAALKRLHSLTAHGLGCRR